MALLIAIPRSHFDALKEALNKVASFDWVARGVIYVFPLDREPPGTLADAICDYCQTNKVRHVLVPKRVHCGEKAISDAGYTVVMGPTIVELIRGDGLLHH